VAQEKIALIAAIGEKTKAVGKEGALLWHLPDDLAHFKKITSGHPVIMGRKTWESLPPRFRPLTNRINIVVTSNPTYDASGATVVNSLRDAFNIPDTGATGDTVFVIGGGILYKEALPYADTLYLTLVESAAEGDAFFPPYESDFSLQSEIMGEGTPQHRFTIWKRK
jgi:dihydrofolate reductase